MATIVIFASSFVLAILLMTIKAWELRNKKSSFVLKFVNKLDTRAEQWVSFAKFKILQFIQSIRYIVLIQIREIFREWLNKVQDRILEEYKVRHNMIMGHKEIAGNGSASFYLRKITEDKNGAKKGKIEETL